MRTGILLSLLLVLCGVFLWVLFPRGEPDSSTAKTGKQNDINKQENRVASKPATSLPMEPAKKGLRKVDGDKTGTEDAVPDLIARLPAKEPPPEPELPKPDIPPKENLVVTIPRPLILAANRVRGEGYDMVLSGIATVPPGKECDDSGKSWPCGTLARTALRKLVRGRTLKCVLGDPTDAKRLPATCAMQGRDLARWLVSQGWAVTQTDQMVGFQKRAKLTKRGLWRGGVDALALVANE